MKNTLKMMWILALGVGLFTMSSCSDDEGNNPDPEPDPKETVCYPTRVETISDGESEVYEYTYNSENQVTRAEYSLEGDMEVYTYTYTNNLLTSASTPDGMAQLVYADGASVPNRINFTQDGEDVEFYIIETDNNENITKVEYHSYFDGQAELESVENYTYNSAGEIETYISQLYDSEDMTFETEIELGDFIFDGKKTPYQNSLAFGISEGFSPLVFAKSNITSASFIIRDGSNVQKLPYTIAYSYNDNDYPTTASSTISSPFGNITANTTITYNCK